MKHFRMTLIYSPAWMSHISQKEYKNFYGSSQLEMTSALVFKGLVHWAEKMTETRLDATKFDWTIGCGCPLLL